MKPLLIRSVISFQKGSGPGSIIIFEQTGPDYPYPTYTGTDRGIYNIKPTDTDTVTIAIAADWGTDTTQSFDVARKMEEHNPDYTIHLGDTYYVGAPHEIEQNFTKPGSPWIRGNKGSFALLGNHEMYARGIAFFKKLLPTLGLKAKQEITQAKRQAFSALKMNIGGYLVWIQVIIP